jgi:hypothetical protein
VTKIATEKLTEEEHAEGFMRRPKHQEPRRSTSTDDGGFVRSTAEARNTEARPMRSTESTTEEPSRSTADAAEGDKTWRK